MKILELLIDELSELTGVDAVALVEQPAIEADFYAFKNVDVLDYVAQQIIKNELFVDRLPGESREDYLGRCIPKLRDEGYDEDQAAAICYDGLSRYKSKFDETEDIYELKIGDYQTRHYDMCPGASELYKKIESGEIDTDMGLAIRAAKLQDSLFYLEKHVIHEMGTASFEDVISAQNLASEIMELARMMGLEEEHQYILGHVQAIRELYQKKNELAYEFESYTDYPESATNAAKRALKWKEEHPDNDCGTRVGWARANQLAKREPISEETIARMASFARHLQHEDVPYSEGCGGLMVDAWGGRAGIEWASNKLESIREENSAQKQDFNKETQRFTFAIDQDQQMVVGPLMIPDKLIFRIDEYGDPYYVFFSENTIKSISEKMMKDKHIDKVNLEHNPEDTVDGYMVSTWLVEDPERDKQQVYGFNHPKGTWMGQYKIEDKEVWQKVKNGEIKGFSVEGFFADKFIQAKQENI